MRTILTSIAVLTCSLIFLCPGAIAAADIYESADASAPDETLIVMEYLWVYGIIERVELRADGLLRVERHVHDRILFDGLNAELAEKGKLSPYGQSMYAMEEGDYDAYWITDAGPDAFDSIISLLVESGFPDIDDTFGDWEVWSVTLRAGDDGARVGRVIRDDHEGFELVLRTLEELALTAKDPGEVDEEKYIEFFGEEESNLGGVS